MNTTLKRRIYGVWLTLPDVFTLQPGNNYQDLISHSSAELAAKAWGRTGAQMRRAIGSFEDRNPDARRKLEQLA